MRLFQTSLVLFLWTFILLPHKAHSGWFSSDSSEESCGYSGDFLKGMKILKKNFDTLYHNFEIRVILCHSE